MPWFGRRTLLNSIPRSQPNGKQGRVDCHADLLEEFNSVRHHAIDWGVTDGCLPVVSPKEFRPSPPSQLDDAYNKLFQENKIFIFDPVVFQILQNCFFSTSIVVFYNSKIL